MTNGEHKEKIAKFAKRVAELGGENPLAEWNAISGLVGFEYERRIYRLQVQGLSSKQDMAARMKKACALALALLDCLRDGITVAGLHKK